MRKKLSRSVAILFFGALSLPILNSCSQNSFSQYEKIDPITLKSACDYVDAIEKIVAQLNNAEVQKFVEEIAKRRETQKLKLTAEELEKITPLLAIEDNFQEIGNAMERERFREAEFVACEKKASQLLQNVEVGQTMRYLQSIERQIEWGKRR